VLASRLSGIVGCVAVAVYHWWVGLALLVVWVVVRRVMVTAVIRQATEFRGQAATMRRAYYFTGLGSKAAAAKEIRVFGLARFVAGRFQQEFRAALGEAAGGMRRIHRRAAFCFVAVLAGYGLAMSVLAADAAGHRIGLATVAVVLPMFAVTMSTGSVSFDDVTLAWTLAGLPDVDTLEQDLRRGAGELVGDQPVAGRPRRSIRLEQVRFRYPEGDKDVLAGVDLDLPAGRSTAIVGVNGAGKTTLVSLLSRLRDPTAGRITVDGVDVRELDPAGWQRTVAVVFQEPVRYPLSAYQNVAFGALEHAEDVEGVHAAAEQAGFRSVAEGLPHGWDTVLTTDLPGGVDLSGGQWQRLSLARALFAARHGAKVLVLDEPTAALDVRAEAEFYGRFLDITRDLTTVVISHRFATVRRADHICVLDDGVITERGSHEELLAADGQYASLYRLQAARFGAKR
jgi:ATP-binding cassette subfamily B protein